MISALLASLDNPVRPGKPHYASRPDLDRHGGLAISNRFRHVAEHEPAILFSIRRRQVLAKGHDADVLARHLNVLPVPRSVTVEMLKVRKRHLISAQMVAEARAWANELTEREIRGPFDLEGAWRRLEARYGIPVATFWSLRYRRDLKDVWASIHTMLRLAVEAERTTKLNNQQHQQTIRDIVRN